MPADASPQTRSPLIRAVILVLSAVAAALLFAMMTLAFVDVIGRYVFNAPVPGAFEIIEFLLGILIFSGLPLVTLDNDHITVNILDHWFGRRALWVKQAIIHLGSAGALIFIARRMWGQAVEYADAQQVTGFLEIEQAPFIFALSVLAGLAALLQLLMAFEHVRAGPQDPPAVDIDTIAEM